MRLKMYLAVASVVAASLSGCSDDKKVWIVVDFEMPNGKSAKMAFNNPSVPGISLADCEQSLQAAVPTLMLGLESRPESRGSHFVSAKCVASVEDPIEPKT